MDRNTKQKARVAIKVTPAVRDGLMVLAKAKGYTYLTDYLASLVK